MENIKSLTREALYSLVWSVPIAELADTYEMKVGPFRILCMKHEIPIPGEDYWINKRAGQILKKKPLPENYTGETIIRFTLSGKEAKASRKSFSEETEKEISAKDDRKQAPDDPRVVAARKTLTGKIKSRYGSDLIWTEGNQLKIGVYPECIEPACRFMNELIAALKTKDHSLYIQDNTTYVKIGEQSLPVLLREKGKKIVAEKGNEYSRSNTYVSSGILIFKVDFERDKNEWKLGDGTFADEAADIVTKLENISVQIYEKERQREEAQKKRGQEKQIKEENEKKTQRELSDFTNLMNTAARWQQAQMIRDFLTAMEKRETEGGRPLSSERETWFKWAHAKVDWFDPLISSPDEWLAHINPDTILRQKEEKKESALTTNDWLGIASMFGNKRY